MTPENMSWIYELFSTDEELMRLLFYKAKNLADDVTLAPRKNILTGKATDKYVSGVDKEEGFTRQDIITDRIKPSLKYDDLKNNEKCRISYYMGAMEKTNNNAVAKYNFTVAVFVPLGHEEKDFRTVKIVRRVFYLLTGVGLPRPGMRLKPTFVSGQSKEYLDNYNCYEMHFSI